MKLIHGDCIEEMKKLEDDSIDLCLTDPPYGTTACKWDVIIPFDEMWEQLKRVVKPNGAICLFGSEPFSSHLRLSNPKMYKYDWVWIKNFGTGIAQSKYMPMKYHELISVFCKKVPMFNKQVTETKSEKTRSHAKAGYTITKTKGSEHTPGMEFTEYKPTGYVNPRSYIEFNTVHNRSKERVHPTQKPVKLLEYLINTYTIPHETVLDFTMGSGSTGEACKNRCRNFIGIEKELKYYDIAVERLK